jgi:serine phosphatase RsbU (regulator of sigma subunit)
VTTPLRLPDASLSKLVRRSFISAFVGIAMVFLATFDVSLALRVRLVAYGALGGVFINLSCYFLGRLYGPWIARKAPRHERALLAGLYFVGGCVGFALATLVAVAFSLVPLGTIQVLLPYFGVISGGAAIVVGLLFYTFGVLQERLRESVERLKEHEFAEKELELARSIQKRLLPPSEVETDGYRVAARNLAARFVAGDFYDIFALGGGALGVAVADVSGKGMGASLIMASVKAVLPLIAAQRSVSETLAELNRKLLAELGPREFVALAYVRCEPDGRFVLANAGLPDPYVVGGDAAPRVLSVPGSRFPLGSRRDVEYESIQGRLHPGEKLFLFTDGLPEAPTPSGDPIGYEELERFLTENSVSPSAFLDRLLDRLRTETAPILSDDWTALALEHTG